MADMVILKSLNGMREEGGVGADGRVRGLSSSRAISTRVMCRGEKRYVYTKQFL